MTIKGYAVVLMKERRLNKQHIHNLLLPLQGKFPSNEEQFQVLVEGISRIGLLHDDGPNSLGQLLRGHSRPTFLGMEEVEGVVAVLATVGLREDDDVITETTQRCNNITPESINLHGCGANNTSPTK